jgi:hypothetical protein
MNLLLGRIRGKVSTFSKILIILFITAGSISLIENIFAQAEENVRIYVHIYSKPFDCGIIEINDATNDYYEDKQYSINLGTTSTIVQFDPPPNAISIGESYHVVPYSTVNIYVNLQTDKTRLVLDIL